MFTKIAIIHELIHSQRPFMHNNLGINVAYYMTFAEANSVGVFQRRSITNTKQVIFKYGDESSAGLRTTEDNLKNFSENGSHSTPNF